jgi:protein SCO1
MGSARRWLPALLLLASALWLAALLLARPTAPAAGWEQAPPEVRAVLWPEPRALGEFSLLTQHGQPFGAADFAAGWSLLFFGYLQCPDVCPTTLQALRVLRQLQPEGSAPLRVVFVSVDPGNDRPEHVGAYLQHFDPTFVGLSGDAAELQRLTAALAVKHVEFVDASGRRSIDHTSSVMLIDPRGRAVAALPPPHQPERMLARIEQVRAYLGN